VREQPQRSPEREAYYSRIAPKNLAPLWEVLRGVQRDEPQPREVPTIWHYDDIRPVLLEAGSLITAKEADRRVLMLENPAFRGTPPPRITHSLFAGLQLIMPARLPPPIATLRVRSDSLSRGSAPTLQSMASGPR
jgi:gentisate 1,2-dioxygenase